MKVCVFEWLCGGGCWFDRRSVYSEENEHHSLVAQGRDMLLAFATDLVDAGHDVCILQDSRLNLPLIDGFTYFSVNDAEQLQSTLIQVANQSDSVAIIAPETELRLLMVCQWLRDLEDRLISPDAQFVRLTSDKNATCHWLASHGVPVPLGCQIADLEKVEQHQPFKFPVVVKPNHGAGSENVRLINSFKELVQLSSSEDWRVEQFVAGTAVSVSVLCGGPTLEPLPVTRQIFAAEPFGHYVDAGYPLDPGLAQRATNLAIKAVQTLPPTNGYIGIDMILGNSMKEADFVIEVNPRLTMSYLKLREVCDFNIANRILTKRQPIK